MNREKFVQQSHFPNVASLGVDSLGSKFVRADLYEVMFEAIVSPELYGEYNN